MFSKITRDNCSLHSITKRKYEVLFHTDLVEIQTEVFKTLKFNYIFIEFNYFNTSAVLYNEIYS
jgi:hypothetical protein